jgi:putative ABC transport system ATP-binding protein
MFEADPIDSRDVVFEAVELKKHFDGGKVAALRGVDLQIRKGEFVAVIGPSGCGKSTLLAMLGSLDKPSEGTLTYRGQSIPDLPDPAAFRSREIGFIFQSFHLLPTFTVLENVQIPMFEGKLSRAQRKERAVELLTSIGLDHRLGHFPSELSGGERQRVAIARSLANGPSVLLADEPTGNVDSSTAKQIMELILQLHREMGMTFVLVTHDLMIAERAYRTVSMRDGRVTSDQVSNHTPTAAIK